MSSLDISLTDTTTLASLAEQYDSDAGLRSPMLKARKLELKVSRSPSLDPTQVKPSRGDAVLMQYMGDGKNPDIYNTAGSQPLGDSSGEESDSEESDPELEDVVDDEEEKKKEEEVCMTKASDEDAPATQASRLEPAAATRELMSVDVNEEPYFSHERSARDGLASTISPQALTGRSIDLGPTYEGGMCVDVGLPSFSSYGIPGNVASIVAVASAALTAQQAIARPDVPGNDGKMAVDEPPTPTMATPTARPETARSNETAPSSGENSLWKPERTAMDATNLNDRTPASTVERSPFRDAYKSDSRSLAGGNPLYASVVQPQHAEANNQLRTPDSLATPQEATGTSTAALHHDRLVADSTQSLATPSSNSSPTSLYSHPPNAFATSNRLPTPLPPIQQYGSQYADTNNTTDPRTPPNVNGIGDNAPVLPSIHTLFSPHGSDSASDDQRLGVSTLDPYGRPFPHAHLPLGGLRSLSAMTHTHHGSPPASPNDKYRRSGDMLSSTGNATGGGGLYYDSTYSIGRPGGDYGRRELATLGVALPSRSHPVLAPAAAAAVLSGIPPAPAAVSASAAASIAAARQAGVQGHDSVSMMETDSMPIEASHAATGSYKCMEPNCRAPAFQTQYLLNSHANVHSSARPHYCRVHGCPRGQPGSGFKRKNEMIRHGLVHESPGYVCPFCPDREHKYPRPDNLQRHVRAHHQDKGKDDPLLRDVLAQRPDGANQRRRRRLA